MMLVEVNQFFFQCKKTLVYKTRKENFNKDIFNKDNTKHTHTMSNKRTHTTTLKHKRPQSLFKKLKCHLKSSFGETFSRGPLCESVISISVGSASEQINLMVNYCYLASSLWHWFWHRPWSWKRRCTRKKYAQNVKKPRRKSFSNFKFFPALVALIDDRNTAP